MTELRILIVEFFNQAKWKESDRYGPLTELVSLDHKPVIYKDFTRQEFLENFYSKVLDSKSLIDKITI